ncbi:heavy-metal-associated domain-containing protein [Clostridium sp. DJ247]|uniref:heavy-metal-associated domain-containing protein n=1 Tax=Clostridium sp. DJ247 TaxID=2726188 RepID=UPI0016236034|nr:heavy metal-associated domain-containing protein [Clostridium sp. DJ247]MBC2581045.1 heavy-metal-associated domain-containing protein [Clostridium sp. DJ247]
MNSLHYNVSGMAGSQSKTKLKNALDKIEGVQEIEVNLAAGTVDIQYNPPANAGQIEHCIRNTGYNINR